MDRLLKQRTIMSKEEQSAAEEAIREFGTTFPKVNVLYGEAFHFAKLGRSAVRVSFKDQQMGTIIENAWLARNLVQAYLEEQALVPEARNQAVDMFQSMF